MTSQCNRTSEQSTLCIYTVSQIQTSCLYHPVQNTALMCLLFLAFKKLLKCHYNDFSYSFIQVKFEFADDLQILSYKTKDQPYYLYSIIFMIYLIGKSICKHCNVLSLSKFNSNQVSDSKFQ